MKISLIEDWEWVVQKAWSIRLTILAGLFASAEVILPLFVDSMPRGVFAVLSFVATMGSLIARVTAQRREHGDE